ncbi:MAG: ferrochelatase [Alphaproteobacteria bacterium]
MAVILFNLGGPHSKESIRPFLYNFFTDPNIIRLPRPFRNIIAFLIARRRSQKEAGTSYGFLGGKSPLLENSGEQASALETALNASGSANYRVFVCMRYWHPVADEVVRAVRDWCADEIVLLPLYPQFSTTTTRSSFGAWKKACAKINLEKPTSAICCYPFNDGFVKASVDNIRAVYEQARTGGHKNLRILFSAHGLPESVIADGDPYQWQCEEGARKIADALNISDLDWRICYQSRVGPKKWIGPSTEEALHQAVKDGKSVIIYPHAFTQEHVETLVEIEIEYRGKAEEMGLHGFYRVPTVSTHPDFIGGLAEVVRSRTSGIASGEHRRLCPDVFKRCCLQAS